MRPDIKLEVGQEWWEVARGIQYSRCIVAIEFDRQLRKINNDRDLVTWRRAGIIDPAFNSTCSRKTFRNWISINWCVLREQSK